MSKVGEESAAEGFVSMSSGKSSLYSVNASEGSSISDDSG